MFELTCVVYILISALVCFFIAKHEKKNPYLWFLIGSIFGFLAIIYLIFYPSNIDPSADKRIKFLIVIFLLAFLFGLCDKYIMGIFL
ncbi:MAG: hypothetical protein PF482_02930 [Desulfobacteraceae bacterium]|jgi:hypothetical protein|nr:hypothetical protein [Desulfobacteraceae bacterium]